MAFTKLTAFTKKVADLPDQPTLPPNELKAQFDAAPEELRGAFNNLIDDLNETFQQGESWTTATLTNGWTNFGSGFEVVGYKKSALNVVHVKGFARNGTMGQPTFTLPTGYRPSVTRRISTVTNDGTNVLPGAIDVKSDGTVVPVIGSNYYVSFEFVLPL